MIKIRSIIVFIITVLLIDTCYAQSFTMGGDLSYINTILDNGGIYRDADGNIVDPYVLFAERGANMVRIRLWHTPENITDKCGSPISTNNLEDAVLAFQRAKAQGMQLNLAFHYGDYFNDPGKQKMPKAWEGLPHETLLDSIYNYTYAVLERMKDEGVIPGIVAIGNETTNGFIDATSTSDGWNWPEDAEKFNIGLTAVDDFNSTYDTEIKKAVHFTDNTASWLSGLFKNQGIINYDIIGISFYPYWSDFNSIQELGNLIKQLKNNYSKEVMIFETGAPYTFGNADSYGNFMNNYGNLSYTVSRQGQKDFLIDLADIVFENGGSGILYWEPAWISSDMCDAWGQGSSYENVSFFDYLKDNTALLAFDVFRYYKKFNDVVEIEGSVAPKIYPNPSSDIIRLSLSKYTDEIIALSIINVSGVILETIPVEAVDSEITVSMDTYEAGIYFLELNTAAGKIVKTIVKE